MNQADYNIIVSEVIVLSPSHVLPLLADLVFHLSNLLIQFTDCLLLLRCTILVVDWGGGGGGGGGRGKIVVEDTYNTL